MINKRIKGLFICMLVFALSFGVMGGSANAKNVILFTLGENGEAVMVKSRTDTVDDYMDVEGYEMISHEADVFLEYKEATHPALSVATDQGVTEGYCMQPYLPGPDEDDYASYDYVKGIDNTRMFSLVSDHEKYKTIASFIVATKYAFGGTGANPNSADGRDPHSGGTYGTYVINDSGNLRAVNGLMIGGKVYEMTVDEARYLTQVVVHYVNNRGNEKNITSVTGKTNPGNTNAAFNHLKAYADSARVQYDNIALLIHTCTLFDNNEVTLPHQSFSWQVYNNKGNEWEDYDGGKLNDSYVSSDGIVKLRVNYYSKNICNKIMSNSSSDNVSVNYSYAPYALNGFSSNQRYYDYFTVENLSNIPIKVTYNNISASKANITNPLLNNMQYDIDTFSQTADIEIRTEDLKKNNWEIELNAYTGEGASSTPCYNAAKGELGTIMYSSYNLQNFLYLSSNSKETETFGITLAFDMTGSLSLNKISGNTEITENNPCYDFTGAIYNVYLVRERGDSDTTNLVGTFEIDSKGQGVVTYSAYNTGDSFTYVLSKLPVGCYFIKEESTPVNGSYQLSSESYYIDITEDNCGETNKLEVSDVPVHDPIAFQVVKQSCEGENVGSATLAGAQFTVEYYKGEYDSLTEIQDGNIQADKVWILETKYSEAGDVSGCILHPEFLVEGSDSLYYDDMGNPILPLGTIVVRETRAPEGYILDGASYSVINMADNSSVELGNHYISKVVVDSGQVKLQVGNKIIVEDEPIRGDLRLTKVDAYSGELLEGISFSITSKTTGEEYVVETDSQGVIDTSVIFGEGALPYDTYVVKELSCEANQNYYIMEEFEITVSKMNEMIDCGMVENIPKPLINTEAFDKVDMDKVVENNTKVTVADRVYYSGLKPGNTYILKGEIINKSTSENLKDNDEVVTTSIEFTPENSSGEVEMLFEFNLNCDGQEIVIYESLYDKETGEELAYHREINSKEQTLTVRPTAVMGATEIRDIEPKTGDVSGVRWVICLIIVSIIGICGTFILKRTRK